MWKYMSFSLKWWWNKVKVSWKVKVVTVKSESKNHKKIKTKTTKNESENRKISEW